MNRTYLRAGTLGLAALLVAGLVPAALHAQGAEQGLAQTTIFAGGLAFQPTVEHSRAVVSVSGNGISFSRAFGPGESLTIGMFDAEGQPLADGTYSWSLELVPDESTARELRIAAIRNGGEAPDPWEALTGAFTVANGTIVDPEFGEPGSARAELDTGLTSSMAPAAASFGTDAAAEDTDELVARRAGLEAESRTTMARAKGPAALAGGFQLGERSGPEREDATALALGASPEPAAIQDNQPAARSQGLTASQPRSDGSNGRPVDE